MVETTHHIEFQHINEQGEKYPEYVYSTYAPQLPIPRVGDTVTFGYVTEDDERLDRWHFNALNQNADYEKTAEFVVERVQWHYHTNREVNDSGKFVNQAEEISTTIIVSGGDE